MLQKSRLLFGTIGFVCALFASPFIASAAAPQSSAPVQLSLWDPIQLVSADSSVSGFRWILFLGSNRDVTGFDLPLFVSKTQGTERGLQLGSFWTSVEEDFVGAQLPFFVSKTGGSHRGLQLGSFWTFVEGDFTGAQLPLLISQTRGSHRGAQLGGLMTVVDGDFAGAQISQAAIVEGKMRGLQLGVGAHAGDGAGVQLGAVSSVKKFRGLQIGALLNMADELQGLQLGLINFNKNGFLPFFPLLNVGVRAPSQ